MRPKSILISPVASDDDGICKAQAVASATTLTLNGDLASTGFTQPAHVLITCAGDDDLVTFTVTGTDRYGQVLTEDIAGSDGGTTAGKCNFSTITSVAADAACDGNVEVGNADSLESQWVPMDKYSGDSSISCTLSSGANMTYAIQHTFTNIQTAGFQENDAKDRKSVV